MLLSSQVARNILENGSDRAMDLEPANPEPTVCYSDLFGRPELQDEAAPAPQIDETTHRSGVVSQLPNETLGAIFDEGRRVITAGEGSWLISVSHVSRRWRDVAIHTPFLWNNIYFGSRSQSPKALGFTQACLERSQNCPLNITLKFGDNSPLRGQREKAADRLRSHLDMIVPHTNRWRTLDVHVHHFISLLTLLDRLPSQIAILKHIRIVLENRTHGPYRREIFSLGAPMLSCAELHGISFTSCKLPLSQLTSLILNHSSRAMSPVEFRMVLTGPSSLRELSLFGDIVAPGGDAWASIYLPCLASLRLRPGAETTFTHLCSALLTPALESLTLQHFTSESIRIFIESLRPYSPKYPKLRLLELRVVEYLDGAAAAQIVSLLEELPMITHLALFSFNSSTYTLVLERLYGVARIGVDDPTQVWLGLASNSSQPTQRVLLPYLCTIGMTPIDEGNIANICKLISTRQAAGRAISCVKTSSYDRVPQDRVQWLREHAVLDYH